VNKNFFSWGGKGNSDCPANAASPWGCFDSFSSSGKTALFSTQNYFSYGGQSPVATSTILTDQFSNGASITTAFDVLAVSGYTPDKGYGAGVASRTAQVKKTEDCLRSIGALR
jgi:hypothetical protein